jgi:hypothetical protein
MQKIEQSRQVDEEYKWRDIKKLGEEAKGAASFTITLRIMDPTQNYRPFPRKKTRVWNMFAGCSHQVPSSSLPFRLKVNKTEIVSPKTNVAVSQQL